MHTSENKAEYFVALENRCQLFSRQVNKFVLKLPKTTPNIEIAKQLVRSAGSIGANYIEANDSLSRKDFIYRIRVAKKEAKETTYWLGLTIAAATQDEMRGELIQESIELTRIFASIIKKSAGISTSDSI